MPRSILIYGAGGAGRELAFGLSVDKTAGNSWKVQGFIDDTPELNGARVDNLPVLGGREYLRKYSGNIAVTAVDDPLVRRGLILQIKRESAACFPVVLAPKSIASPFVEWGEGCILLPMNIVQPGVRFGNFVWVNGGNRVGHGAVIGEFTTLFSGILIGGNVSIGSGCLIGSGAIILPRKKIGDGSIIGAGSLVSRDIPPHVVAAGVPARVLKKRKVDKAGKSRRPENPFS